MVERLSRVVRIVLGKIIIKVLLMPRIRRVFSRLVVLYETAHVERELGRLNQSGKVHPDFRHYLPQTEERIERLRRIINKRPVAIILHGPSAKELESRINELRDCDICYFGLNAFTVPEKHILQKINRTFSVVMYSAIESGTDSKINDVADFLERQEDNLFISERDSFRALGQKFSLDKFIKKYDRKLLFFTGSAVTSITMIGSGDLWRKGGLFLQVPSVEYPLHFPSQSSFSILLSLALIGQASMVIVFGGDGGRINGQELYFRETASNPDFVAEQNLTVYTRVFNVTMPLLLERVYQLYELTPVNIINCSPKSHYTALPKLSYDETFALLKSFKKDAD